VQCTDSDVSFRAFAHLVHSDLRPGHISHGEVCPGEWVYHVMPITTATLMAPASGAHRRLETLPVGSGTGDIGEAAPTPQMVEEDAIRRAHAIDAHGAQGRQLAAAPAADVPGIHVRFRVIKNIGSMNILLSLNDKPLRVIPPYTFLDTTVSHSEHILCNVDRYLLANGTSARPMRYYMAVYGGTTCAHYEVQMETFTSSCSEALAAVHVPNATVAETHGSPGARECPQDSVDCVLSMRHYMRGACAANERAPPFVLQLPYFADHLPDNLVLEIEDLNAEDNPSSLEVKVYSETGSHEVLEALTPILTTSTARKRIFSLGLSSIEMAANVCSGMCWRNGTANFSIVVGCRANPVRFRVIAMQTRLELEPGVPVHGEVCPNNWIYHRFAIRDTPEAHSAGGIRFLIHKHQGDIYYVMSRWDRTPGFAACNANEYPMTGRGDGSVDLCSLSSRFTNNVSAHRRLSAAAPVGVTATGQVLLSNEVLYGYIGLYGGASCAHYTLDTQFLPPTTNCSTDSIGCR